jgi:hypothetical protein
MCIFCLAAGALRGIPWISLSLLPLFRKQPRLHTFGSLAPPQISTETLKRNLKIPWGRKDQSQDSDIYHQDDCAVACAGRYIKDTGSGL